MWTQPRKRTRDRWHSISCACTLTRARKRKRARTKGWKWGRGQGRGSYPPGQFSEWNNPDAARQQFPFQPNRQADLYFPENLTVFHVWPNLISLFGQHLFWNPYIYLALLDCSSKKLSKNVQVHIQNLSQSANIVKTTWQAVPYINWMARKELSLHVLCAGCTIPTIQPIWF